jgi:hypothetical protein
MSMLPPDDRSALENRAARLEKKLGIPDDQRRGSDVKHNPFVAVEIEGIRVWERPTDIDNDPSGLVQTTLVPVTAGSSGVLSVSKTSVSDSPANSAAQGKVSSLVCWVYTFTHMRHCIGRSLDREVRLDWSRR